MLAVALVSFVFYGVKIYMTHYEQPPKFEPTDIVLYVQGCVLCVCELWFVHARVMPGHAKIGEAVSAIRHSKMHPASNAEATTVRTPTRGVDKRARAAHAPCSCRPPALSFLPHEHRAVGPGVWSVALPPRTPIGALRVLASPSVARSPHATVEHHG